MDINSQVDWWLAVDSCWLVFVGPAYSLYYDLEDLSAAEKAKQERSPVPVWRFLNDIWWNLPDKKSIQSLLEFNTLCDICSETWVFEEREEENV